jgi:hypothetical protein
VAFKTIPRRFTRVNRAGLNDGEAGKRMNWQTNEGRKDSDPEIRLPTIRLSKTSRDRSR